MSKSSFTYQFCIGKGGFGKVWKVERKKSKLEYAMKEMNKARILTKRSVKSVMNERQILTQLHSPFLVNMYYAFQDRENLYLVMDLLNGGDLRYHICRYRRFDEETTKFFVACLVAGLEYCHEKQIIHRDIKPENLVVDDDGYVRITDFGIARVWRPENAQDTSGTPGYMAPEVMCRQNHTTAVDYFAVGVMAYECMFGRRPYVGKSRKEIRDHIISKQVQIKKQEVPRGWSLEAADFINKMIQRKAHNRLGNNGAAEVKNHPWLRDFNWQDLSEKRIRAPFIPPLEDNFDQKNINEEWKDLEDPEFKENMQNLRRGSVQALFNGYYYDYQLAALANNQAQINTFNKETRVRSGGTSPESEPEANQNIFDNPQLLLQQFNHQISLHQQQQMGSQPTLHVTTNLNALAAQYQQHNSHGNSNSNYQSQSNQLKSQDSQMIRSSKNTRKRERELSGNASNRQKQQLLQQQLQQQNSGLSGTQNVAGTNTNMTSQQQQQIERTFRQSQQMQNQHSNIRASHNMQQIKGGQSIQSLQHQQSVNQNMKMSHLSHISGGNGNMKQMSSSSNSGAAVTGSTNFNSLPSKQQQQIMMAAGNMPNQLGFSDNSGYPSSASGHHSQIQQRSSLNTGTNNSAQAPGPPDSQLHMMSVNSQQNQSASGGNSNSNANGGGTGNQQRYSKQINNILSGVSSSGSNNQHPYQPESRSHMTAAIHLHQHKSMPNSHYQSQHNSPVNARSIGGAIPQKQQTMIQNSNNGRTTANNSRSNVNSIQGTPSKHTKQNSMTMNQQIPQNQGQLGAVGLSKHPILANKQQKMHQQMQFKQTLASQQHYNPNGQPKGGQPQLGQTGYKSIVHFAKSECPTPKQRVIEDGVKGHSTQARFFSRKNSNSNQNILLQSQNQGIMGKANQTGSSMHQQQQFLPQNSQPQNTSNSRHSHNGLSPHQQQQSLKLQKQLQQFQMKRQTGGQQIISGVGPNQLMNVPKNGFMLSQNSQTNSANHSRRTSQKSAGKQQNIQNSSTHFQQQIANQPIKQGGKQNARGINIYSTSHSAYNSSGHAGGHSSTAGQSQLSQMMMQNSNIYQTHSQQPSNGLMGSTNQRNLSQNQQQLAPPDSSTSIHTSQLRDSLQSNGGGGQPNTVIHPSKKYQEMITGQGGSMMGMKKQGIQKGSSHNVSMTANNPAMHYSTQQHQPPMAQMQASHSSSFNNSAQVGRTNSQQKSPIVNGEPDAQASKY